MKHITSKALSIAVSGVFSVAVLCFAPSPAQAQDAPGLGANLTGKIKEAGAVGVGTAADETAKGADINTAVSKGSSAALNHSLGTAAPAAPAAAPAAEEAVPATPPAE
jgi:hypothetical protein